LTAGGALEVAGAVTVAGGVSGLTVAGASELTGGVACSSVGGAAFAGAPVFAGGRTSVGAGSLSWVVGSGGMPFGAAGVGTVPLSVSALK
jgi:hypothetical protein